jgi:hypothetical protein
MSIACRWLLSIVAVFHFFNYGFAQHCIDESAIKTHLNTQTDEERSAFIQELSKAQFFGSILRWTAVAGPSMIPILRAISRPGMNFNSIPGEAEISLAKLGDKTALMELQRELEQNPDGGFAVDKLIHVGTDRGFSLLVAFLRQHLSDNSLHREYGDYSDDVRWHIIAALASLALDLPENIDPNHPYNSWIEWWDKRQGRVALSISTQITDPYLACLARKVEWGFPDAILDMANARSPEAIPILRTLEHVGTVAYTLNSIRGRARFALAKLGDDEAFKAIELAVIEYGASADIDMLWKISGKRAVGALVSALDSSFPLKTYGSTVPPDPKDKRNYAEYKKMASQYRRNTDIAILNTLNTMVVRPPLLTGDVENQKRQWKESWEKNRDTAQFAGQTNPAFE